MKTYNQLEVATEIAWQLGDTLPAPRAESRWRIVDLAQEVINSGLITEESEDIDETISAWLIDRGMK